MAVHNLLGKQGEEAAVVYLKQKGYKIRHVNWRFINKELDIIADQNNELVVVEVKTRNFNCIERPQDAITKGKIKNIIEATHYYIMQYDIVLETRFDVISVIVNKGGGMDITHIERAFIP